MVRLHWLRDLQCIAMWNYIHPTQAFILENSWKISFWHKMRRQMRKKIHSTYIQIYILPVIKTVKNISWKFKWKSDLQCSMELRTVEVSSFIRGKISQNHNHLLKHAEISKYIFLCLNNFNHSKIKLSIRVVIVFHTFCCLKD